MSREGVGWVLSYLCAGALAMTMHGCGASTAPVVKAILDGAVWSCGIIEPVCDAAELACRFVPGSSGGETPALLVTPAVVQSVEPSP